MNAAPVKRRLMTAAVTAVALLFALSCAAFAAAPDVEYIAPGPSYFTGEDPHVVIHLSSVAGWAKGIDTIRATLTPEGTPPPPKEYNDVMQFFSRLGETRIVGGQRGLLLMYRGVTEVDGETFREQYDHFISLLQGEGVDKATFEADLGENVTPLNILDSEGVTIYTALLTLEEGVYLLTAESLSGLSDLGRRGAYEQERAASESKDKEAADEPDQSFVRFVYPDVMEVFEDFPLLKSEDQLPDEPFVAEITFRKDEYGASANFDSNAAQFFREEAMTAEGAPEPSFIGGDAILGFLTLPGLSSRFDLATDVLPTLQGENRMVAEQGVQMAAQFGFTPEDITKLVTGPIMAAFGGSAISPIGPVPGLYLKVDNDAGAVNTKLVETLFRNADQMGVPMVPISSDRWTTAYATKGFATITLAANDDSFFFGLLDPEKLGEAAQPVSSIQGFAATPAMGTMAVSLSHLDTLVDRLGRQLEMMVPEEKEIAMAREAIHKALARLEVFYIQRTSPDSMEAGVWFRNETTQ
ncbi:MAG: hypothetical protein K9L28_08840 [Synergistales bacterium]|nr:hypothetical protein [Synergistales bacterium]